MGDDEDEEEEVDEMLVLGRLLCSFWVRYFQQCQLFLMSIEALYLCGEQPIGYIIISIGLLSVCGNGL